MNVIIACEFSGVVRDAFIARGHHAVSCDLLPTLSPGPHLLGDIRDQDLTLYDLMIAHPTCTFLCALENPIGCISTRIRKPDQIIQPFQFGHDASKSTCLWLKGLPTLKPTLYVEPRIVNGRK